MVSGGVEALHEIDSQLHILPNQVHVKLTHPASNLLHRGLQFKAIKGGLPQEVHQQIVFVLKVVIKRADGQIRSSADIPNCHGVSADAIRKAVNIPVII